MRHGLGGFGLVVVMVGVTMLARADGTATMSSRLQQEPSAKQSSAADTVTGCIRSAPGDPSRAESTGSRFTLEVLDNASRGTEEIGAPAPATSPPITYVLDAPASVALAKHVGHQVELTGKLQSPAADESGPVTPKRTPAAASSTKSPGEHRTFAVTSLKMLAAQCPR